MKIANNCVKTTKDDVMKSLSFFSKLETRLTVFVQTDPEITFQEVTTCIEDLKKVGVTRFCINETLWTSDEPMQKIKQ